MNNIYIDKSIQPHLLLASSSTPMKKVTPMGLNNYNLVSVLDLKLIASTVDAYQQQHKSTIFTIHHHGLFLLLQRRFFRFVLIIIISRSSTIIGPATDRSSDG